MCRLTLRAYVEENSVLCELLAIITLNTDTSDRFGCGTRFGACQLNKVTDLVTFDCLIPGSYPDTLYRLLDNIL